MFQSTIKHLKIILFFSTIATFYGPGTAQAQTSHFSTKLSSPQKTSKANQSKSDRSKTTSINNYHLKSNGDSNLSSKATAAISKNQNSAQDSDPNPQLQPQKQIPPEPNTKHRPRKATATDRSLEINRLKEIKAILAQEPPLAVLRQAALKTADADPNLTAWWMARTRWSQLLPEFKITFQKDTQRDESLDRYQDEPDRFGVDTDKDYGIQLSAKWELSKLIYNPEEVRVHSAITTRAKRREAVLTLLLGYYFERKKLIIINHVQFQSNPAPPLTAPQKKSKLVETQNKAVTDKNIVHPITSRIEMQLRIEELTAFIDALTGGMLTGTME